MGPLLGWGEAARNWTNTGAITSLSALGACSKAVFKLQMSQAGAAFPHSASISGSKRVAHPLGAEGRRGVVAVIKASARSWHLLLLSELHRSTEDLNCGVLQELESSRINDNACGGLSESHDAGVLVPGDSG